MALCNTLIEVPVKDNVNKPHINSMEKYITSIAVDVHRVAELQLSGIKNQTSFLFKAEQEKVNLWCSIVDKAIKENLDCFMEEMKEECPMVHESTISIFSLNESARQEIANCVTELSFFSVSYAILNSLLCESVPEGIAIDSSPSTYLSGGEYVDKLWKTFQHSKSNILSNPGFFECLQCTILNNLLTDPTQDMNWVDYIQKYNFFNPRKNEWLNFLAENERANASKNCDGLFSKPSGSNSKDVCNNVTCNECEKWIKKFCMSEKQHELDIQALESKYTRELHQLEECLTKNNEYEEQIQTLKDLYEQKLQFNSDQILEDNIREAYKTEIEDLKEMFKKGLVAIENSHYRITSEMEKKHRDEISVLQAEKEKALELEAQATITGNSRLQIVLSFEAIKRSHEQQLREETALMKEDLLKKLQNSEHDSFFCKYRNDLENFEI
ncbi:protein outspread [Caerostris extrusa]|uniref:Protein outspread n=1 Tax=Caerostris extrusa TaxID=172846 RepID=A0AAV4W1E3_CAEEX|nr:protein outspread [Caerostris extrusa]